MGPDVELGTEVQTHAALPAAYLPKPSDPSVKTHLDLSSLTITPDGRTLVLTEWLNGDPGG